MGTVREVSRRQFIGTTGATALGLLAGGGGGAARAKTASGEFAFVEAEGFDDHGGWDLDQQSMDVMGSPYLLAHGLGYPVADATTRVTFPSAGRYRLWARTRDWVAPWQAPGAPGKFQVLIDGEPVDEIFGTKSDPWHWHDGGMVTVGETASVALRDLTGFEGRCEALLFCKDPEFTPAHDAQTLEKFRRRLLGLPDEPEEGGAFDMVVVGGGLAGTCAALSAARNGLKVALVQDRPVLGGNGSSEVRVWPEGHTNHEPFPHIGDIVMELLPVPKCGIMNGTRAENFADEHKLDVVGAEKNVTLITEHRVVDVEARDNTIRSVVAQSTRTARQVRLRARLFADCTGDACVGHLAGADYEYEVGDGVNNMGSTNLWRPMDASNEEAVLKCECKDKDALSTLLEEQGKVEQPFPRCPWAVDLSDKPFPGRGKFGEKPNLGNLTRWYWESGFDQNAVTDIERIRDLNFRAMYGAWDTLKNVDGLYPYHRLEWAAFIAGKRESRRLMGDVVLDADDFRDGTKFEDGAFPCTWHIDLHMPHPKYQPGNEGDEFIATYTRGKEYRYEGPYWAPYRCLYSRNISNLFMAGRDISVTKTGLGPVRVMKTCGMMGEVVGKAAAICVKRETTPRGVYQSYLAELKEMMRQPGSDKPYRTRIERNTTMLAAGMARRAADDSEKYRIDQLPKELKGLDCVVIPRGIYEHPGAGYRFTITQPAEIYIAVHDRGSFAPKGWDKTNMRVEWGGGYTDTVYKKRFNAGAVEIPGHVGREGNYYGLPHVAIVSGSTIELSEAN